MPALDAVLFLSKRSSRLEVIQAVGRVMRRAAGKKYGYIIIPIYVPNNIDAADALDEDKRYEIVWTVLSALRSHDELFSAVLAKIDLLNMKVNNGIITVAATDFHVGEDGKLHPADSDNNNYPRDKQYEFDIPPEFKAVQNYIYARMVERCGDKFTYETWGKGVASICEKHIAQIAHIIDTQSAAGKAFDAFLSTLRSNINDSISRDEAIQMLSQQIVTEPVFDALFGSSQFTDENPVSHFMHNMIAALGQYGLDKEVKMLAPFYETVKRSVDKIDNAAARQKLLVKLYDNFFRMAGGSGGALLTCFATYPRQNRKRPPTDWALSTRPLKSWTLSCIA